MATMLNRATVLCLTMLVLVHQFSIVASQNGNKPSYACGSESANFGFCNKELPISQRVADLISRLSLDEKVQQLINTASGVSRLGIPPYQWWSEALHGVANTGPGTTFAGSIPGAVSFPQVILSAASFNPSLWKAMGKVVSTEARALYNNGQAGLTYWSPNINIYRDPRWGRGQETPGEDPHLASQYAINYVRGLQDVDDGSSDKLKVAACCKHYTAYDIDSWQGTDRFHFNAEVTQQDLDDTYQPPFKDCITKGNAACVMCSYNRVNGVPTCVDQDLLIGTVRGKWGLNGYIASDCDSVEVLYDSIHYTATQEDAVADSILAGLNMNCGVFLANYTAKAVSEGKLDEKKVDESLSYLYTVLMRLGYFNGDPSQQEFGNLGASDVCSDEHRNLALEAAKQGIVLLKNEAQNGLGLPFSASKIGKLAIIGPNANVTTTMIGNYAGVPCSYTTPLQGLSSYAPNVVYEPGCSDVACQSDSLIDNAVKAAQSADAVVLIVGLDQSQEREAFDRTSLSFPGEQQNLILQVANNVSKPLVLVIMSGGPVDIAFAKSLSAIPSILWVGYPGEAGGQAIAEVIFGDHNPAGRLPMSWYTEDYTKIDMRNMNMRPNATTGYPGRTYRFYNGDDAIYEFGDGLSYTTFSHVVTTAPTQISLKRQQRDGSSATSLTSLSDTTLHVHQLQCEELNFNINVRVQNIGAHHGDHVVMVFWSPPRETIKDGAPLKQLVGFQRINTILSPQQSKEVSITLNPCTHLSYVNGVGQKLVKLGTHNLLIGDFNHEIHIHN